MNHTHKSLLILQGCWFLFCFFFLNHTSKIIQAKKSQILFISPVLSITSRDLPFQYFSKLFHISIGKKPQKYQKIEKKTLLHSQSHFNTYF